MLCGRGVISVLGGVRGSALYISSLFFVTVFLISLFSLLSLFSLFSVTVSLVYIFICVCKLMLELSSRSLNRFLLHADEMYVAGRRSAETMR